MSGILTRAALAASLAIQPLAGSAESDSGAYLAARQAGADHDYPAASRYFAQSLIYDPQNPRLLEAGLAAFVGMGDFGRARAIADTLVEAGVDSQQGNLVLFATATADGEWRRIYDLLAEGHSVSPLVDGLVQAWAHLGQGNMTRAVESFDAVIDADGMQPYGLYHKALALASVGDFEGAQAIFAGGDRGHVTVRSVLAHAQVLSQLGRNADAATLIRTVFGDAPDPRLDAILTRLGAGETLPFDTVTGPRAGVGEVAHMIAGLIDGETRDEVTLQYAQVARFLDDTNIDAKILAGTVLQKLGRAEEAAAAFASVPQDHPAWPGAELGRIDALEDAGDTQAATDAAAALAQARPDLALPQARLGDLLRRQDRMEPALDAYTDALDLMEDDDPTRWAVLYTRAIAAHALGRWDVAEADFRAALDLNPDQPQVLNYLGYSLVERGEKLDEALGMIETAVRQQPQNGAIVDSLGWVLFQLGQYEQAVVHLEDAAALEAVDPVINDHLGDAYWMVGRRTEARFQWTRALSFGPTEAEAEKIRGKLANGLDRAPEGAVDMDVATDGG